MIYIISDILPADRSGGAIVLKRHLDNLNKGIRYKAQPSNDLIKANLIYKIVKYLERTRIRPYILAFQPFYEKLLSIDKSNVDNLEKPDLILTIAHGRKCFIAKKISKYLKVPLVTIFHDWYPASSGAHPRLLWFLNREFKKLSRHSTVALCVSEQLRDKLGTYENGIVLYPIPSKTYPLNNELKQDINKFGKIRIYYAGFCGGAYRDMLKEMISVINDYNAYQLHISGSESDGLSNYVSGFSNVFINGFIPEKVWGTYFNDADILLLLIDFDPKRKLHFSTHFPSKLVEYCQRGKLIVIWGPEYSTAVQWAQSTHGALFFTNPSAKDFMEFLKQVDVSSSMEIIDNAIRQANTEFNPKRLQQSFEEQIVKLIQNK